MVAKAAQPPKLPGLSKRWALMGLLFTGITLVYCLRVNLSVAVQDMQDEFDWSSSEKGLLLSSFFWGYVAGQIPGSLLAQRFGAKIVFGLGIFLPTVLTFLTPLCAKNINLLYMVRSLTGLTEAVTFPALFHMLPAWTPRAERSAMVSFVMSGMYMGDILGFGLSGVIVAADAKIGAMKFGGWEWVFYFFAFLGLIWSIAWFWLAHELPQDHPTMHPDELHYLRSEVDASSVKYKAKPTSIDYSTAGKHGGREAFTPLLQNDGEGDDDDLELIGTPQRAMSYGAQVVRSIPIVAILTHPAAIALYVNQYTTNWVAYFLMSEMPSYMNEELNFDLQSAGLLCIAPYVGNWITAFFSGKIADHLIQHKGWSVRDTRQVFNRIGQLIPALLLIVGGYSPTAGGAVTCLTLAMFFYGCIAASVHPNALEISPNYSSTLYVIANLLGATTGITSPIVTNLAVDKLGSSGWQVMFFITGLQNLIGVTVWHFWQSSTIVPEINNPAMREQF